MELVVKGGTSAPTGSSSQHERGPEGGRRKLRRDFQRHLRWRIFGVTDPVVPLRFTPG